MSKIERSNERKENWETIQRMVEAGASIEEMMKATGYAKKTVRSAISSIRAREPEEEENLVYVEKKKPVVERIVIDGKVYLDITEAFLATDWEVVEVGV